MENVLVWLGIIFPMALGSIGSAIGCMIGGGAVAGAMTREKSGHGAMLIMSAAPSSQSIYGLVLMLLIMGKAKAGDPTMALGAQFLAIGLLSGTAIMMSAIMQGKCCAAGIRATVEEKSVYGKCWLPIGMTEGFAVFAMVFGIVALG